MGHVFTKIKVVNTVDLAMAAGKTRGGKAAQIRSVVIPDALIDTGASDLCLPERYITQLGLIPYKRRVRVTTANGVVLRRKYWGGMVSIRDRSCQCDVMEMPDNAPTLVGVLPLEALDYKIDPKKERLVGKHGREQVTLMY